MAELHRAILRFVQHVDFMLFNGDMLGPVCLIVIATPGILISRKLRFTLRDRWNLLLFLALPSIWVAMIPWGAAFLDAMDVRFKSPVWAYWPVFVNLLGFPVLAGAFVYRARGARAVAAIYVICNLWGWFFGWFVGGMAVSGDWI